MHESEGSADGSLIVERDAGGYSSLVAGRPFGGGEVVAGFTAQEVLREPNYLTLQVGPDRHIMLAPEYIRYTNHSCEPNVFFDIERGQIVALRPIATGEGITFFYPSTEWAMDRAFTCHCGTPSCLGEIAGASQLDPAVLANYRLAGHIEAALAEARGLDAPRHAGSSRTVPL